MSITKGLIFLISIFSLGLVHEDLQAFLETNVPKSSKKQKVTLGVADAKIGAAITEDLQIQCSQTGVVPEVIRGNNKHICCCIMNNIYISAKTVTSSFH